MISNGETTGSVDITGFCTTIYMLNVILMERNRAVIEQKMEDVVTQPNTAPVGNAQTTDLQTKTPETNKDGDPTGNVVTISLFQMEQGQNATRTVINLAAAVLHVLTLVMIFGLDVLQTSLIVCVMIVQTTES